MVYNCRDLAAQIQPTILFPASIPMGKCTATAQLDARMTRVLPFLYLGNREDARDYDALKTVGVTHILNVTKDMPNYFEKKQDFEYLRIPVRKLRSCKEMKSVCCQAISLVLSKSLWPQSTLLLSHIVSFV